MKCPYCEAMISDTAKKCQHCGEWVSAQGQTSMPSPAYQPQTPAPAYRPAPSGYPGQGQQVVVNVPQQAESVTFAVVTLLFYIFLYPVGFLLNIIGVFTGPKRGCFLSMLLLFVVVPTILTIVLFVFVGLNEDAIIKWLEELEREMK